MPPKRLHWALPSQLSGRRRLARNVRLLGAAVVTGLLVLAGSFLPGVAPAGAWAASPPDIYWTQANATAAPPPLAYATAAYDADNSTVVLFGGREADGTLSSSTWVWNGSGWAQAQPAHSPPARELGSMAFDPTLHQLILFGGQASNGTLLDDTWAWNGVSWIQVGTGGPAPGPREAAALSYEHSGSLLLFGGTGFADDTPTPSTTLPGLSPPPSGGTVLGDTWLWTSAGWVRSNGSGPPARSGAVAAYDQPNGTTVLFGGESTPTYAAVPAPLADTWIWNGSGWAATKPASNPPARFGAAADDFPVLGGPLVLAGEGASGGLADAWVWAGGRWTQPRIQGSSTPRIGAAAAYDAATRTLVLFGGEGGGGTTLGDTVLVADEAPTTPPTTPGPHTTTTTRPPGVTTTSRPRATPPTKPSGADSHGTVAAGSTTTLPPGGHSVVPTQMFSLQASRKQVQRGESVQLSGSGFAPGSFVTLAFHSSPAALGGAVVGLNGTFAKVVIIPAGAAAGVHHFTATGTTPTGTTATLTVAVTVMAAHHKGISRLATVALVGLAILIPVAAYLAMAGAGLWRRRRQGVG